MTATANTGWTVEEALRWFWFAGDKIDPLKVGYLNQLADPYSQKVCDIEGVNACARLNVISGMHLRVMGLPLKEKLSSGELIAVGCPGSAAHAPTKINRAQWDAVASFDMDQSAAFDRAGNVIFVGLRISPAAGQAASQPRRSADQTAILAVFGHLEWLQNRPHLSKKQMAARIQRRDDLSGVSDVSVKAAFKRLEQKSLDTLERAISRFLAGL
jgi:hypothetical protein